MDFSQTLPRFPIYRFRFRFQARSFGTLPVQCGSIIRGVLGRAMRENCCPDSRRMSCPECACAGHCDYHAFWGPENLAPDQYFARYNRYPRPYVIEPPLHFSRLEPGDTFEFNLVLMGDAAAASLPAWLRAARTAGEYGFGRERVRMELKEISEANLHGEPGRRLVEIRDRHDYICAPVPVFLDDLPGISALDAPVELVKVHFLTPARILENDRPVTELRFYLLIQAILRRMSMLCELLDPGTDWRPDFNLYGRLADRISVAGDASEWRDRQRYSGSQHKEHAVGGLTGHIVYRGPDLEIFMPLLVFGCLVHIGKGTVFGNGRVELDYV